MIPGFDGAVVTGEVEESVCAMLPGKANTTVVVLGILTMLTRGFIETLTPWRDLSAEMDDWFMV